jgi:hypothetical protein
MNRILGATALVAAVAAAVPAWAQTAEDLNRMEAARVAGAPAPVYPAPAYAPVYAYPYAYPYSYAYPAYGYYPVGWGWGRWHGGWRRHW